MIRICLLGLLIAGTAAAAQERYVEPTEAIVVTGIPIGDHRSRLAACLERNCPPDEDADASLALAEALMLNGDYGEARRTVQASLGRNRDEAQGYPEPVSDLYRAHSRLSRHMGFDQAALRSSHGILDALQEGLPREDHRHFTARLELAEMQMALGRVGAARRELDRLADVARRNGREDVAILAELRRHWFDYLADPHGADRSRLIEMSRWTDPGRRLQAAGARLLLSRIYRIEGKNDRADAMLADLARGTSAQRRLLFSPRFSLPQQELDPVLDGDTSTIMAFGNVRNRVSLNYENKWIDVGYWVMPDGSVSDLEVVRSGTEPDWADSLLASIRGRLYSTGEQPTYKLERYTYTAAWEPATGTHMQRRSPRARVEYLDLTTSDAPAATTGG